jgi:hypothetical protein
MEGIRTILWWWDSPPVNGGNGQQQHQQQNDETTEAASIPEDRVPDDESAVTPLRATDFRGLISLSSPYSLTAMQQTFVKHGLDKALVDRIFGGERDAYDPKKIVQECITNNTALAAYLPPMRIYMVVA